MTFEEIKNKYLYEFCDPGNGPVLVVKLIRERKMSGNYLIHFVSCTEDKEGYDYVDNVFISEDGKNFRLNTNGTSKGWKIEYHPMNIEFIYNFIERLFTYYKTGDTLIERVLEDEV